MLLDDEVEALRLRKHFVEPYVDIKRHISLKLIEPRSLLLLDAVVRWDNCLMDDFLWWTDLALLVDCLVEILFVVVEAFMFLCVI